MSDLFAPLTRFDLWQGDCLTEMKRIPTGSVDMICTDPPYGMDYQSNRRTASEQHRKIENDSDLSWIDEFVAESYRVAKNGTGHYFFCSFHKIDLFKQSIEKRFKLKNCLVWEKDNHSTGDLKGDFAPKIEFVLFAHKGRALIRGKRDPNIFKFARTRNELHPTQKPVDMMEYLISKFSDAGDVVLDPFMGSGTTGVACRNTGRSFIGIEKDPAYFRIASERVLCDT